MDMAKFVAILENRALFFTRVAQLEDKFEGSFPASQPPLSRLIDLLAPGTIPPDAVIEMAPGLENMWQFIREWVSVNCWHASPHESDAMWRLYSPSTAPVAIRSTVGRLRSSLGKRPPFEEGFGGGDQFHIGMVQYIDFEKDRIPGAGFAAQFFRKRKSFEHERELRAILIDFPITPDGHVDQTRLAHDAGRLVSVDLPTLIEDVIVGPDAPRWYLPLLTKLLDRYGVGVTPKASSLEASPHY